MASILSDKAMEIIQATLQDRGISVTQLALLMDESQSTINRTVRGDSDVTFERLYNMCKALDLDIRDVIDHIERPHSKKKKRI